MNNISKLGEDIEKRLQNIEFTQEETSKIFIELNNKLNTLEDQVKNTHQTFNLLLQNINTKNMNNNNNKKINGKFLESSDSSDSDSSIEINNNKTNIIKKNKQNINNSRRFF
jgi:uncharacterized coiled-coil protein SlyX